MLELHWRRRLVEGIGAGGGGVLWKEREREREGRGGGSWASRVMLIGEERGRG